MCKQEGAWQNNDEKHYDCVLQQANYAFVKVYRHNFLVLPVKHPWNDHLICLCSHVLERVRPCSTDAQCWEPKEREKSQGLTSEFKEPGKNAGPTRI
jgi:hypothetical protein